MVGDRTALSKTSRTFCLPHLKTQSRSVFFCPLRNWNQPVTTPDFLLLHGVTLDSRHNKQWWTCLMKRECVRGPSIPLAAILCFHLVKLLWSCSFIPWFLRKCRERVCFGSTKLLNLVLLSYFVYIIFLRSLKYCFVTTKTKLNPPLLIGLFIFRPQQFASGRCRVNPFALAIENRDASRERGSVAANGAFAASAMESQGVVPRAHRAGYVQRFRLSKR